MNFKKKLIKFLVIIPSFLPLLFIFLIFQEKWYYMDQGVLYRAYIHGFLTIFLVIFFTFLFYNLLNIKLPKIRNKLEFHNFLQLLFIIYFGIYVVLGEFIWGFLLSAIASINQDSPEIVTHIFPVAAITVILIYRIMLYFEETKISIRKDLDGVLPIIFLKSKRFMGIIEDFIIGGVFASGLIIFFGSGGLLPKEKNYLMSIGLSNLFIIGLISIFIELWIWLMSVQFKEELKEEIKITKPKGNKIKPITKQKYDILKILLSIPLLKKVYLHYKKYPNRYRSIIGILFVLVIIFGIYYTFTNMPKYEEKEISGNAFILRFNITEKNIYPIKYLEPNPLDVSDYSYIIIKKESRNRSEILTKTDKDRFDKGILRYNIIGYLNVQNQRTKSLLKYSIMVNFSNEKLMEKIDSITKNYGNTLADGEILLFLNENNIKETCVIFENIMTNELDPMFNIRKTYMFNNSNEIDVIQYNEEFHIVPYNQYITYLTQNNITSSSFKEAIKLYPAYIVSEANKTSNWNQTKAYEYCYSNRDTFSY